MATPTVGILLKARDEASAVLRKTAGEVKGLTGVIGRMGSSLGVFAGLATAAAGAGAAVFAMGKHLATEAEHLERVSSSTGSTSQQVEKLEQTFKRMGLTAEDADKALGFMARSIGQGKKALGDMGITTKNAYEAIEQFAAKARAANDPTNALRISSELMGRTGRVVAGTLTTLKENLDSTGAAMDAAGFTITESMQKKLAVLDDQMDLLNIQFGGFKRTIMFDMVPAALAITKQLLALYEIMKLIGSIPVLKVVLTFVREQFDMTKVRDDLKLVAIDIQAIAIAFRDGEEAARQFKKEALGGAGLANAPAFGGMGGSGASGGKGGGGSWAPEKRKGKGGLVNVGGGGLDPDAEDALDEFGVPMSLSGVGKRTKKVAGPSPREKRLAELRAAMRLTADEAKQLLKVLESIEGQDKKNVTAAATFKSLTGLTYDEALGEDIQPKLRTGGAPQVEGVSVSALRPVEKVSTEQLEEWDRQVREVLDTTNTLQLAFETVGGEWMKVVEEMTSATALLDSGFNMLFNGLQSTVTNVMGDILNQAGSLKVTFGSIIKSMVDAAIREMNRIVAMKIFNFILSLLLRGGFKIGGGGATPGTGQGPGSPITPGVTGGGFQSPPAPVPGGFGARQAAGARQATRTAVGAGAGARVATRAATGPTAQAMGAAAPPARLGVASPLERAIAAIRVPALLRARVPVAAEVRRAPMAIKVNLGPLEAMLRELLAEKGRPRDGQGRGNTYVINAIDAHDVVASLLLPGGSMRKANDRLSVGGAY